MEVKALPYLVPAPPPPAGQHLQRVLYGAMQPILGARLLLTSRELLLTALVPVGCVAVLCALSALSELGDGPRAMVLDFYKTFAVLAPLPSVLMRRHYGRLVVRGRARLGLPDAEPCIEPLWRAIKRAVAQAVLIVIAVMPAAAVLGMVPLLGAPIIRVVAAVWALHWIVVDAFDASRVLPPGQPGARAPCERDPWFVRGALQAAALVPVLGWFLRKFARLCDRLAAPWREEIATVEAQATVAFGFGLTTAALLATPVLNLFFRPIVLVGAVHVLGQIEGGAGPSRVGAGKN